MRAIDIKISVIILAILCTAAAAKTIYVDDNAIGANNGSNWDNAYIYLQEALADAKDSEKPVEIRVAQGTYKPDGGIVAIPEFDWRTLTFQLISGVSLKGGYAGAADPNARDIELYETILSGDLAGNDVDVNDPEDLFLEPSRAENSYNIVTASETDETAVLDGLTITSGNGIRQTWEDSKDGGGIYSIYSRPSLICCTFSRNSGRYGGAMYNLESNPTLTGCRFTQNASRSGGGIYNGNHSSPSLTDCIFTVNESGDGGGMCNDDYSRPTIANCIFTGNTAGGDGGGMCNKNNSKPTLTHCTFTENASGKGGGMSNAACLPILTHCDFNSNSASSGGGMYNVAVANSPREGVTRFVECTFTANTSRKGGGMYNWKGEPILLNCSFVENLASWGDSGVYNDGGGIYNDESSPILTNCIFIGNQADWQAGGMYNFRSSPSITNCTFIRNRAVLGGGTANCKSQATIINCTFAGNLAQNGNALGCDSYEQKGPSNIELINCILWDGGEEIWNNDNSTIIITYSNIQGVWEDQGNIDADPLFADPNNGDYHLKSQAGRWDPNSGSWIVDDVTSPCIDAGDPNSDWSGELWPHGERINMGAYGGTAEASMSVEAEGMSLPRVLYVYDDDMAATDSFKSLLEMYGVSVTSVSVNNLEQVSMNDYDLVILGDDTAWAQALEDGQFVAAVEDSNKPVVGLGHGGYDFFGELELSIGKPHGAHTSNNSITVLDPNSLLFSTPYPIDIPEDGILQLYTETDSVSIYLWPEVPETVTVLAGEANNTGYYPLVMEHNRYLLWGFTESPQKMTEVGKSLFINFVIRAANSAW